MTDAMSGLSRSTLRVLAVAAVTLAASSAQPVLAATAASAGLILFTWSMGSRLPLTAGDEHRWAAVAALAVTVGSLLSPLSSIPASIEPVRPLLLAFAVGACSIAFVGGTRLYARRLAVILGLLVVLVATGALIASEWNSDLGTDVYLAHRAAGSAILEGQNPYGDAVRFLDGSPFAPEGRVIEGYAYPPIVLFTYGLAGAFTDPRLVSALAWIGLVAWFGWRAPRFEHDSEVALGLFLLLSTLPVWSLVWYAAWTEPLSLVIFALSAALWKRRSMVAAVLLGLAIASKQYFAFLAPLLVLHRDEFRLRRLGIVCTTVLVTLGPALLIDPSAFISATVGNLATIGFRPDTQSIPGLLFAFGIDFTLPLWVWLAMGLSVGAVIARVRHSTSFFVGRAGLTLGFVFVIGLAFVNYWVLVAGLIAIAAVIDASDSSGLDRVGSAERSGPVSTRLQLS